MSGYTQLKRIFLDISGKQKIIYLSYPYNIATKVINKAIAIMDNLRRQLEKSHINALTTFYFEKNSCSRPISPRLIIEYRSCVWESVGTKNFLELIISKVDKFGGYNYNNTLKVFLDAAQIINKSSLNICSNEYLTATDDTSESKPDHMAFFFDSYFLFNAGHMSILCETLDVLSIFYPNSYFLIFFDVKMVLFPSLLQKIIEKHKNCILIDCSHMPLAFSDKTLNLKHKSIFQAFSSNETRFAIRNNSLLNPSVTFNLTGLEDSPSNYTQDSAGICLNSKSRFRNNEMLENLRRNYVVIHFRNSAYMSDSPRNTLPIPLRVGLFELILSLDLDIVLLGVNNPSDIVKLNGLHYLQEMETVEDSLQLDLMGGAVATIGSVSGITHLSYCLQKPTLLIDVCSPKRTPTNYGCYKAIFKELYQNNAKVCQSNYYKYPNSSFNWCVPGKENVFLSSGYQMKCNSNNALYQAFVELLVDSGHSSLITEREIKMIQEFKSMKRSSLAFEESKLLYSRNPDKHLMIHPTNLSSSSWRS